MAGDYPMPKWESEAERLQIQHKTWTKNLGYLVHPALQKNLGPHARIADVATGTAGWLRDLADSMPATARLDGYDISDAHFPPKSSLPANVTLSLANAKEAFPSHLHGTYDLVNLRLLVTAMNESDWELVTRNCAMLLKPGGAIQWTEGDLFGSRPLRGGGAETSVSTIEYVRGVFINALGHRFAFGHSTLPEVFDAVGLSDIKTDVVASDRCPETRDAHTRCGVKAIFTWGRKRAKDGIREGWTLDEIDELERRAEHEIAAGGYTRYELFVATGVKA